MACHFRKMAEWNGKKSCNTLSKASDEVTEQNRITEWKINKNCKFLNWIANVTVIVQTNCVYCVFCVHSSFFLSLHLSHICLLCGVGFQSIKIEWNGSEIFFASHISNAVVNAKAQPFKHHSHLSWNWNVVNEFGVFVFLYIFQRIEYFLSSP